MTDDLAFAGIARQAAMVREGAVSSVELVELYLERIERIDPQLNSYRVVMAERALAEAAQADSRRAGGDERPLLGVPIAIKDNVDVAGELTGNGTGCATKRATEDAELVRRLRTAGCVVLGKTNLPELAIMGTTEGPAFGVTRNPWSTEHTPGGSSGGSGAAVAAGLAAGAHATDGAGSIRIPAACCHLFGLKPQRGRVPLAPDEEHWNGLSVAGSVTRTVLDNALFLDAVAGPGAAPGGPALPDRSFADLARELPGRLKIAVSLRPPFLSRVSAETRHAVDQMAELLRALGHDVEYVEPPLTDWPTEVLPRYLKGIEEEAEKTPNRARLQRRTRGFARLGSLIPQAALDRARRIEGQVSDRYNRVLEGRDVLLTPIATTPPPGAAQWEGVSALRTLLEMTMVYPYCVVWNATGQPAAAVPAGFTDSGLPMSVQLIAPPRREDVLLSLATQIESETSWPDARPPLG